MRSVSGCRAVALCRAEGGTPPPVWVNSSTGTIYRHATDRPQAEDDGDLGTGFSVSVPRAWEQALAVVLRLKGLDMRVLGDSRVVGAR